MPKEENPVSLQFVIAENVRRIRRERGLLQEDIATAARWVGLKWSSVTVTQIESQSRLLSLDEFLLLPMILQCSLTDLVTVEEDDRSVVLGYGTILDGATLPRLVSQDGPQLNEDDVPMLPALEYRLDSRIKEAVTRGGLEQTLLSYLKIREGARGEAERKAAQTLKIAAVDITGLSLRLWGKTLTEERDARAQEQADQGKEQRAVRGHITRALLRDIQDENYLRLTALEAHPDADPDVKLKPVSADERALRKISLLDYEQKEAARERAQKPYGRWMRFKIQEAFEKEGTVA